MHHNCTDIYTVVASMLKQGLVSASPRVDPAEKYNQLRDYISQLAWEWSPPWKRWMEVRKSGLLWSDCCPHDLNSHIDYNKKKMDG